MNQRSIFAFWERQERNNNVIPQCLDDTPKAPVLGSFWTVQSLGSWTLSCFWGRRIALKLVVAESCESVWDGWNRVDT